MYPRNIGRLALLSLFALPLGLGATPQDFAVTLDQANSTSVIAGTYAVDLTTTVIGNFDPVTNPTGTQTVPGLFGGGGNNLIPVDLALSGPVAHNGPATGAMDLNLDRLANTLACSNLNWDLLGGQNAQSDVLLDLLFQTFRSVTPNSTFFGGFPVQIPGGTQTISALIAVQNGVASGTLTPLVTPSQYAFQINVPVDVSLVVDFNGAPTPVGPVPSLLPLIGTLTVNGDTLEVDFAVQVAVNQTVIDPLPGFQLMDVPLPVPTVLPAGATANLLLAGTVDEADLDWTVDLLLSGDGAANCGFSSYCMVPPNSTGQMGRLAVSGSADVGQADLLLTTSQLPSNVFGIYLMSPGQGFLPLAPPAQGILCLGAPFFRFSDFIFSSGPGGTSQFAVPFQNLPQGQIFQAGSTWNFQAWHRDMNPSNTSNLTHAVTVVFCP